MKLQVYSYSEVKKQIVFMNISELQSLYAKHPGIGATAKLLEESSVTKIFLGGLCASSAALIFSTLRSEERRVGKECRL